MNHSLPQSTDRLGSPLSQTVIDTSVLCHPARWLLLVLVVIGGLMLVCGIVGATPAYASGDGPFELSWSSLETDATYSVAWGDVDGDGDLDLAVGNGHENKMYRNDGVAGSEPQMTLAWLSDEDDDTRSVAWGDVDGDGDLDLAVGNYGDPNRVYLNDGGTLAASADWSSTEDEPTWNVAWGDVDGDGRLDLAAGNGTGPDHVYHNDGTRLATTATYSTTEISFTHSVAWGDVDSDGDLDLAVGVAAIPYGPPGKVLIYRNDDGALTMTATQTIPVVNVDVIAWGDHDNDGDPDLAVGRGGEIRLYRNDGGILTGDQTITDGAGRTMAWGDYDGDGDLDLVGGTTTPPYTVRLYRNDGGTLITSTVWSSSLDDRVYTVAWGDVDGDGDLDLAIGNQNQPNRIYSNDSATLGTTPVWSPADDDDTFSVAWGDYDGDEDLDLFAGNAYIPPNDKLYRNDDGTLTGRAVYSPTEAVYTFGVAWGDYDGDGNLDLISGRRLYHNEGATLTASAVFTLPTYEPASVAWADYDGDGDLDLAVGLEGSSAPLHNFLFRNDDGTLTANAVYTTAEADYTKSLAWGDVDGDGDLDLAAGNRSGPDRLYRNDGGMLTAGAVYSTSETDYTRCVAWGDYDGDGDLDLATGGTLNRLYRNDGGALTPSAVWSSVDSDGQYRYCVAWGDYDGDGDLDLAAGGQRVRMYRNDDGTLVGRAVWSADAGISAYSVAWGDVDGDGDLDLAAGDALLLNTRDGRSLPGSVPVVSLARPGSNADLYSDPQIWSGSSIPITYTLSDPQGDLVKVVRAFYSPDGGGRWFPAAAASGTVTANLVTTATYTYNWDVFGSGFFGQSDNVVFRLVAVPVITHAANSTPGPYLYGSYGSQTFPFRVRGTQVRVMSGTVPTADAIIYRLPAGQSSGGSLIADSAGNPFHTDLQGYLQGRSQLDEGDRLLAMLPITWTESYTVYYTSGTPTVMGVDAYTVTASGVQTLTVSASNPLILFNLSMSLEWDAHKDTAYLEQLQFDLQRASEYLYDFSNGQVALGDIEVFQNVDEWVYSHVVIKANNRLRPFAIQGGIVTTDTIDPDHDIPTDTIRYSPGQVTMGSAWNRYGNPGQSLGDDWAIILAHELSHYLLFHDDVYLGMDDTGNLISVDTCQGSAMGDLYDRPDNTEFIADEAYWQTYCHNTLPEQTLGRNEWETMQLWYQWLISPTATNAGPSTMPFDFAHIHIHNPYTPTDTLVDPTFYIDYEGGGASSSEGRAYLLRDEYVVNLGSPFGGQNRIIARGAQVDDRLCVFDRPMAQFGCETIDPGDDRLAMRQDANWNPIITLTPINSTTLTINVTNPVSFSFPLRARVFPDLGYGQDPITLLPTDDAYSGTLELAYPAMSGNIQLWVEEPATETSPRRETIIAYTIGGNPGMFRGAGGMFRGAGGMFRGAGGMFRGAGGMFRGAGAPILSPDGQMIFFTENPIDFITGTFFTIQGMAGLPPLPPGRTLIGQGYNLVASSGFTLPAGSASIQYLSNDVLVAGANEADLLLYFWDGSSWSALDTILDTYYNLVSAPSQGQGVYALMASVKIPLYGPGWNLISYPVYATRRVTEALISIQGVYTTVYGFEANDTNDPWRIYDVTMPDWGNSLGVLEFGKGYWINASDSITLHLKTGVAGANMAGEADQGLPEPPSTFYGTILPGEGFTPTAGMTIGAWIGDAPCGQGKSRDISGQIGYVVHVFSDGLGATGCGTPGKVVRFTVDEQRMSNEITWDNWQVWHLDLNPATERKAYLPLIVRSANR